MTLAQRIEALEAAVELARGRVESASVDHAAGVVAKARGRLRHGTENCVVALAGPTGSGKSSIFNTLAGTEISVAGVRRPTTSATHAAVWGTDASSLLDWLEVRHRHQLASDPSAQLDGLVLLDLPDFDSTEAANRMEVDRLIRLVDLLIWIVEPQKYADHALHAGYVQPLAGHADVMRFVLSKSDTLGPAQLQETTGDLRRLLEADGVAAPTVIAVTTAGEASGLDELRQVVIDAVGERRAVTDRIRADLRESAHMLGHDAAAGHGATEVSIKRSERKQLVDGLARAAGVDEAITVVSRQYQRDAASMTGWPPTRWVSRFRRSPIRELPRPGQSAVAHAEVGASLRRIGDHVAESLERPWDTAVRRRALDQADSVKAELAKVNVAAMRDLRKPPRWWHSVKWLQRAVGLVAAVGGVWLVALAVVGGLLRLDTNAMTPMVWDWMPLPTLLLLAGGLAGLLLALLSRGLAVIGGRRRGRQAAVAWRERVEGVANDHVIAPIEAALHDRHQLSELLRSVAE